jgi:hypothetical protein
MTAVFWVTYGLMWLVLGVVVVLIILLYRQFGLMIMPGGRRISYGGLDIGRRAPVLPLRLRDGSDLAYDWVQDITGPTAWQGTVAVFALAGCPICDALSHSMEISDLPERYPALRFLWIDGEKEHERVLLDSWTVSVSRHAHAHSAMDVPGTPFAYYVSPDGHIVSKGLVNDLPDFMALIDQGRNGVGNSSHVSELAMPTTGRMEEL